MHEDERRASSFSRLLRRSCFYTAVRGPTFVVHSVDMRDLPRLYSVQYASTVKKVPVCTVLCQNVTYSVICEKLASRRQDILKRVPVAASNGLILGYGPSFEFEL